MKLIIGFVLGIAMAGSAVAAKDQLFRLTKVDTKNNAMQCAAHQGKAALLFDIDEDGEIAQPFGAFCVTMAK